MSRFIIITVSTCVAIICCIILLFGAHAAAGGGSTVGVSYTGQTVDSIEFDNIKVDAKYALGGGYGNSEYSCAALVMKFYKEVYGFDVWNLSSSGAIPTCSNGESFSLTDTPRVGDIVRFQDRTHWALVKSVTGNTVTLIEQNWGYYSAGGYVAAVNRTVEIGDAQVSFLTYSAYGITKNAQVEQQQQQEYITWEEALKAAFPEKEGYSVESEDSLKAVDNTQQIDDTLNHTLITK